MPCPHNLEYIYHPWRKPLLPIQWKDAPGKKSKVSIIKIMNRRTYLISVFEDTLAHLKVY